jgi:LacI family transcriptional regulator
MAARIPHVALLVETSREYGRGLLRGIIRYEREHGPWSIFFQPRGLGDPIPDWLADWDGDGILLRVDNRKVAEAVIACGMPAVDLRGLLGLKMPRVGIDNGAMVDLVFDHLRDRGFRHLAFCGLPRGLNHWMDFRGDCFAQRAKEAGLVCHMFRARRHGRSTGAWESEQEQIASWIAGLPRPLGLMACNDDRGLQVLDACRRAGVRVPDEVAVVGVDNDEFLCNLSRPPLTSVDVGVERAGYEAAALLDRLMRRKRVAQQQIYFPPIGVVVRQSTDVMAIDDRALVELVRYIREHACTGVRVNEVLKQSKLSSSTLLRRFKALLGRTPKQEILRVQLEEAKRLLASTDLPVSGIAERAGFGELKRLSTVFRARFGMSPGAFRRQARPT